TSPMPEVKRAMICSFLLTLGMRPRLSVFFPFFVSDAISLSLLEKTFGGKLHSRRERIHNFASVLFNIHMVENLLNLSALINQKSFSCKPHILLAHELALSVNAISVRDLMIRIAQERKRQIILRGKLLVRLFRVQRNSQNFYVLPFKLLKTVSERASLFRTARRVILRIKIEHNPLA